MVGQQGQSLALIFSLLLVVIVSVVKAEGENAPNVDKVALEETGESEKVDLVLQSHLKSEEFRRWVEEQEEKVVEKIMEKISNPNDTPFQHEAKFAVARYLVNVTFTAMTRRLENQKAGKRQTIFPETSAATGHPASPEPVVNIIEKIKIIVNETQNSVNATNITSTTTQEPPQEEVLVFKGDGEDTQVNSSLPSSAGVPSLPSAVTVSTVEFPASSVLESVNSTESNETTTVPPGKEKPLWEEILTFNFSAALNGGGDVQRLLNRINGAEGASLLSRLNLTALGGGNGTQGNLFMRLNLTALGGGEGGLLSRLNLTALGGGSEGGVNLFERLNLTSGGGNIFERLNLTSGGGSLFERLNLTSGGGSLFERLNLTSGGGSLFERLNLTSGGGSLFERLNLTSGGGSLFERLNLTSGGGSLFERLNLTSGGGSLLERLNLTGGGNLLERLNLTGGGNLLERLNLTGGGNLLERLNLTGLGGGGSLLERLNLTMLESGGNLLSRLNLTEGGQGGLPFAIYPPPEGLFNHPTPPPMNDSVRLSQMYLGSQVEKLMGDITNSNLTGVLESTINIATPSTVGVLVNALLNILLCNPLDRFNGNCGIE